MLNDVNNFNLESRLQGEISITSDTQMAPPLKELMDLLMKVKESRKADLKLSIQKTKIMACPSEMYPRKVLKVWSPLWESTGR